MYAHSTGQVKSNVVFVVSPYCLSNHLTVHHQIGLILHLYNVTIILHCYLTYMSRQNLRSIGYLEKGGKRFARFEKQITYVIIIALTLTYIDITTKNIFPILAQQ